MEIWKDIKEYEGLYQVSNLGNVKSIERAVKDATRERIQHLKSKIIKPTDNGKGYQIVSLNRNGRKNKYVHRLVAEAFLDNPKNKKEVNHKDFNKKNNCVDNLEWVSQKENKIHYRKNDISLEHLIKRTQRNREKYELRLSRYRGIIIQMYNKGSNIEEINKKTGISQSKITQILKENNIQIRKAKLFKNNLIIQKDKNNKVVKKYDNYKDIVKFIQNNTLTKAKEITIRHEIHDAITKRRNTNFKYGYFWELEKIYEI